MIQSRFNSPTGSRIASFAAGVLLLAITALPAYADNNDDKDKGGKAPEAPIALLIPAVGAGALGVRAVVARHRRGSR